MSNSNSFLPRCIATGAILTEENDSEAHVIPNAIGGRLKPTGVLSRQGNTMIGDLIEAPFLKNYHQIIALLRAKRQRGEHPNFQVEAPDGKIYLIKPDGSLTPGKPEYHAEPHGDGEKVQVVARTMEEMKTMLGRVKKKYPHFDIEKALQHAKSTTTPSPKFKFQLSVGPNVLFPMAFAAATTFNASRGLPIHPLFKTYLKGLKGGDKASPPDTFYWEPETSWVVPPHAGTHTICTVLSSRRAKAVTILRLVGLPGVAVITDYVGDRTRIVSSTVDIVEGKEIYIRPDEQAIVKSPWSATHILGEGALFQLQTRRMNEVLQLAKSLGFIQ